MAKKQKKEPSNILTMMYQDGYKKGYADGLKRGKSLMASWIEQLQAGKTIDQIEQEQKK